MSTLLRYEASAAIAALCFFIPTLLLSQVIIREKVEIMPKSPDKGTTKLQRLARTADASDRFYNPPLFVLDPLWQRMGLTLPSTVTISGTVDIAGPIGGNQRASVVYIDPFGTEHEIAWKGREPIGWGGNMYEGQSPYTGVLNKGSFPSVSLYLFDGQWSSRVGEVTLGDNTLTYNFNGLLYQGTFPAVPVTATATVTGSFLPGVLLDHWNILAQDMTVTGLDSTWVRFAPIDGTGGTAVERLYRPWGISPREAEITARVDAKGDYVFLAYTERAGEEEEPVSATYHSGKELTMSLMYTPFLVYNDRRGTFNGEKDTVYVTVTGGGKSKTIPVILKKTQILLGETKYFYVAVVDGRPKIQETSSTSEPEDLMPEFEWGSEPVEIVESGPTLGKRLGVYWEREKPDGTNLPSGMIRLVGRYWHADSLYKVRLITADPYETVSLVVEVKKPEKLGDSHQIIESVFGSNFNLDEFIVKYAGENGIPPQMIKGHIEKETPFKNAFRYEPFEDISIQNTPKKKTNFITKEDGTLLPFVVTEAGMGGDFPTSHANVYPTDYERTPQKIAQLLEDHLERYVNRKDLIVIGKKDFTDELTNDLKKRYKYSVEIGLTAMDAANFAIEVMKNSFHWKEYSDHYNDLYAQTRISTSYGLTQMLYATAVSSKFRETDSRYAPPNSLFMERSDIAQPPEKLNEHNFLFPRYIDLMLQRLRASLGKPETIPDHAWNGGFEKIWMKSFQKHNPGEEDYGKNVLNMSKNYLPKQ